MSEDSQKEEKQTSLTKKFRPASFKSMQGQELPRTILQKISENPKGVTRSLILAGSYGTGKSLVLDSDILTPDGFKKMSEMEVGQPIIGSDGQTYQVTGVYPQGELQVIEIEFEEDTDKDTIVKCSLDHLWEVRQCTSKMVLPQTSVVNTKYLIDNFEKYTFLVDYPDFYEGNRFKSIKSIKLTNDYEEMQCIEVNSPDHLYITNNYTLTHNTTSSRIFAKSLNCETKTGDACNKCQSCIDINNGSNLYQEYDSSVVGNVERMKELKDVISYSVSSGYKVVVFDECLAYDTILNVKEGNNFSYKSIGEIVENKLPVRVMSFNKQENIYEYKLITGWFKNSGKWVYEYIFKSDTGYYTISASDNHILFDENFNELTFGSLQVNQKVLVFTNLIAKGQSDVKIAEFVSKINIRYLSETYDIEVEDNHNYFANNILVHNCHLVTKQAMSTLLKVLEEADSNVWFLFPTTDPDKLMDTIKSRSIILTYECLTNEEIKEQLQYVAKEENKEVPPDVEEYIVRRVKGHARDALQQLELFFLLGYEDYNKGCILLDKEYFNIIKYTLSNNMTEARETIKRILKQPVPYIRQDFEEVIKKISNSIYISHQENKNGLTDRKLYQRIIQYYFENQRNVIDTNHWFIFLSSLVSVIKEPEFFNFK